MPWNVYFLKQSINYLWQTNSFTMKQLHLARLLWVPTMTNKVHDSDTKSQTNVTKHDTTTTNNTQTCVCMWCVYYERERRNKINWTSHSVAHNEMDWRLLWWKTVAKPVPLDEDGLMNGKACQKHTMTKLFFRHSLLYIQSDSVSRFAFPWTVLYATKMKFHLIWIVWWLCNSSNRRRNASANINSFFSP